MTTYPNKAMATRELQLGDVVSDPRIVGPWASMIVKQLTPQAVTFFRPYGRADNFSYTGGVICYIGLEEFSVPRDNAFEWHVWQRDELK